MSKKNKRKFDDVMDATKEVGEKVEKTSRAFWTDFKKFAVKGNIVDLAIAVVIGTAFNKIVSSLVSCVITPLTSLIIKTGNLSDLRIILTPAVEADEEAGIEAVEEIAVRYGEFIQAAIDFLVIALSIFVVLRAFMKVKSTFKRKEIEAAAERARLTEEKKKADAAIEAERRALDDEKREKERREFIDDVAVQANVLTEMRDIMLRMEKALPSREG